MLQEITRCPKCGMDVEKTGYNQFGCWSCGHLGRYRLVNKETGEMFESESPIYPLSKRKDDKWIVIDNEEVLND